MQEIELKPIPITPEDFDEMEELISRHFRDEIYLPLLKEMNVKRNILQNSFQDLIDEIKSGRITFYRGQFKGRFNSTISRELKRLGALWDRRQGTFKIPHSKLTPDLKTAIALSEDRFNKTIHRIDKRLSEMLPEEIANKMKLEKYFDSSLWRTNKKIKESIKKISVTPDLTDDARKKIAEEYSNNMKLYIKDWTESEIKKLRQQIKTKTFAGSRYEDMIEKIQRSYSVSRNKAKFLARQETNLLMTKFKESRYKDIGANKYRWKCVVGSPNHPVRPMHKMQDGKVFDWDSPPVIDSKGNRKNPGEDFGCRCTAVPIVQF